MLSTSTTLLGRLFQVFIILLVKEIFLDYNDTSELVICIYFV